MRFFPVQTNQASTDMRKNLKTGKWYAVYGKECDLPGCHCDAWVDEVPIPSKDAGRVDAGSATRHNNGHALGLEKLVGEICGLLNIEGVEGIGQPVTLLSAGDLPPKFLGFVERLRGGWIEGDEEMLLITLSAPGTDRRRKSALERFQEAVVLLGCYVREKRRISR